MLSKLFGNWGQKKNPPEDIAFLHELFEVQRSFYGDSSMPAWRVQTPIDRLQRAGQKREPPPGDLEWWVELRRGLLERFPRADALALRWMCDYSGLRDRAQQEAQKASLDPVHLQPTNLLLYWVAHHPTSDAADVIASVVRDYLRGRRPFTDNSEHYYAERQIEILGRLDSADRVHPYARGRTLLRDAVAAHAKARAEAGSNPLTRSPVFSVARKVAQVFVPPMLEAGYLNRDDLESVLLEFPDLVRLGRIKENELPSQPREAYYAAIDRLVGRAAAEDPDPQVGRALQELSFRGLDHVLVACRALERHPKERPPAASDSFTPHRLAWAVCILRRVEAPSEADVARADELATLKPATLLTAALFSVRWAPLFEKQLGWPGLAALVQWLHRYGGPSLWGYRSQQADEDDDGPGGIDRASALEAVAQLGEDRVKQVLKHWVARGLYGDALYYLQAILGWNAAEVEAGFLKRNKRAVRALGLLPDEGDVLQRYLALRRFAKESRQFGPQRQASEQLAAESGLANLAVTAGYLDLAPFEWAMEAQIAQEVDPSSRRWTVGDYTVWLTMDESGTIVVERAGKSLKSVPAAVRQAPEYAEVKEAQELLREQWSRVRRRLEVAMALGEVMDRQAFAPALTTPAGRAMVPQLVLRCWLAGADEPVDLLGFATLDAVAVTPDQIERYQVAHPWQLAERGTLRAWQRRLVEQGLRQPFNQLFRPVYTMTESERERRRSSRFDGRTVRLGTLKERLKRCGWQPDGEGGFMRRFPGRTTFTLTFANGAGYLESDELVTLGDVWLGGWSSDQIAIDPLHYSEAMRDVDLATLVTRPGSEPIVVTREMIAVRAALVQAVAPDADCDGEIARLYGYTIYLATGAFFNPDGVAIARPAQEVPATFPYPDPDRDTAAVFARALEVVSARGGL